MGDKKQKKVVCKYCGHTQKTKSELDMITCSSCQRKTPVNKIKPKDDENATADE